MNLLDSQDQITALISSIDGSCFLGFRDHNMASPCPFPNDSRRGSPKQRGNNFASSTPQHPNWRSDNRNARSNENASRDFKSPPRFQDIRVITGVANSDSGLEESPSMGNE